MRIDTRPKYRVKEKIIVKGYENEITIPYKGKSLEKIFDKGSIVVGKTKILVDKIFFQLLKLQPKILLTKIQNNLLLVELSLH